MSDKAQILDYETAPPRRRVYWLVWFGIVTLASAIAYLSRPVPPPPQPPLIFVTGRVPVTVPGIETTLVPAPTTEPSPQPGEIVIPTQPTTGP